MAVFAASEVVGSAKDIVMDGKCTAVYCGLLARRLESIVITVFYETQLIDCSLFEIGNEHASMIEIIQ